MVYADQHYPNIDSVVEMLESPKSQGAGNSSHSEGHSQDWDLGMGWQGALDCYYGGWSEGAAKAYELAEKLKPLPKGPRTTFRRDVVGAFPNVPAYLAGVPNSMYRVSQKQAMGMPFVHLYMCISYNSFITAGTAFDRGCALVALADALETSGCRVKITLCDIRQCMNANVKYRAYYMVKDYGDRLDVDNLIFTAAHPAFFRRVCFAASERSDNAHVVGDTYSGSYSRSVNLEDSDCPDDGVAINVRFPYLKENGGTPESFLRGFVALLPEELQTEIEGEGE